MRWKWLSENMRARGKKKPASVTGRGLSQGRNAQGGLRSKNDLTAMSDTVTALLLTLELAGSGHHAGKEPLSRKGFEPYFFPKLSHRGGIEPHHSLTPSRAIVSACLYCSPMPGSCYLPVPPHSIQAVFALPADGHRGKRGGRRIMKPCRPASAISGESRRPGDVSIQCRAARTKPLY